MPNNDTRPTKAQRQADARARAAEIRRQQEKTAKRNRFLAIGGAILAVVVVAGAIGFAFLSSQHNKTDFAQVAFGAADADSASLVAPDLSAVSKPSTANDSGGIPVSAAGVGKAGSGDTVLQVYFDMQCPICAQFDAVNSSDLKALAREPGITVVYQPLSFLDYQSQGTRYSSRAANALMTVADKDPDHFEAFMTALFQNQPGEQTSGMADSKIASIATGVGVPQSVVDMFTDTVTGTYQLKDADGNTTDHTGTWRTFTPFIAAATDYANQQPVFQPKGISTPTLMLDGQQIGAGGADGVNWSQAGSLRTAVEAAAARKG